MALTEDLARIEDLVLPRDPSFRRVDPEVRDASLRETRHHAHEGDTEALLLSAMRLMALPRNGHTRLIPNSAIEVLPVRFVSLGAEVHLVGSAPGTSAPIGKVIAANGTPVDRIATAAKPFLAGTRQRQRVIGALLLAWPFALKRLGAAPQGDSTTYRVLAAAGEITEVTLDHQHRVPAATLYPASEHGRADPGWTPARFAEITDWPGLGLSVTLPSFFDPGGGSLQAAIEDSAARVRASPDAPLVIDLRGNTGGDFLKTLPLIDALSESAERRVAALVDKFTFSAAIVFVALLRHRLDRRLFVIGEEMGDGSRFYAEGGSLDLPISGAVVRYSTAFHDWETGTTDATTPPEIARHVVAAGDLRPNMNWRATRRLQETPPALYRRILDRLKD